MSSFYQSTLVLKRTSRLVAYLKYSNLHILLVAFGLISGTFVLVGLPFSIPVLLSGCSGAFLIYQLDRCLWGGVEDLTNQPERIIWIQGHRKYVISSCVVMGGAGATGVLWLSAQTVLFGLALAGVGVLYLLPVFPQGVHPKSIWYLKPLVIAGAWALGGVLFPVAQSGLLLTPQIALLFFYRLLFILPNILLTDWQDQSGDRAAGHTSIAMLLPEKKLRCIAGASALIAITLGICAGYRGNWPLYFYLDLCGPLIMILICLKPLRRSHLVYGFCLDMVVAWPVMTSLFAWLVL